MGPVVRNDSSTWPTTPGCSSQPEDLANAEFNGWSYERHGKEYVPLYEAKMLSHFDHRFSTYRGATQAQLNMGALPRLSDKEHDDPHVEPLARYWVDRSQVVCASSRTGGTATGFSAGETSAEPSDADIHPVCAADIGRG